MTALLQDLASRQAERNPERTALVLGGERMTYGELEATSNRLARVLHGSGCRRGDRVHLLMPKSPMAIAAIQAVLKVDAIYVPLDPAGPLPRLARIIDACGDRWILAAGPVDDLLDGLFEQPGFAAQHAVGRLDDSTAGGSHYRPAFTIADLDAYPADRPGCANGAEDAAHLLFTSGSTGVPKGVIVTHGSVLAFITWATRYFQFSSSDRISGHPPLHFDLSTFDIFATLGVGAELHLVPADLSLLPHQLARFIREHELTQWFSVPSVLNYMAKFDAVRQDDFPTVRRLLWCGEVFPTSALIYWMRRLPHVAFTNLYGPTETTIASSYYTVPSCPTDERQAIPIGTPCEGEELLVLDERLQPVPPNEIGDIYIRGVGLSPGYWRDPEKTSAAFLTYRNGSGAESRVYRTGDLGRVGPDGLVYFLGRADSQIKSRGYRIELGEIEAALNALGVVRACAVVALPSPSFEGTQIGCAYVRAEGDVTPASLRASLARQLPSYMVPTRWLPVDEMPLNANGKINRPALQQRFLQAQ